MKKKHFTLIPLLLLSLMIFISCPQEIKPELPEDKYSTVSFDSFPEAVKEINIYRGDSCIATLHSNYSSKVFRNLEGELKIDVVYKDLTYSDSKYVGYGTLENDENQFTIFLNNRELVNEADFEYTPYYPNPDENIQTNLKLHYTSTFKCTPDLEKLDFTFQNSPKKILKTDVRLRDETIYAYFDFTELSESLVATLQEKVGSETYTFTPVTEGGLYYVPKIAPLYLTIEPDKYSKIIYYDFMADGKTMSDDNATDKKFTYTFYENRTTGQIIKITGSSPVGKNTKRIEVPAYPIHVTGCYISVKDNSSKGFYSQEEISNGFKFDFYDDNNICNEIEIEFYYDSTTPDNKQYGNLSTDENPLKVYANGKEIINAYQEYNFYPDDDIPINAQFKFEGTFECSDDLIKITFENSPRLISKEEVRILNDTNISYFDLSEVGNNIDTSIKYIDENDKTTLAYPLEYYEYPHNTIEFMELTPSFIIEFSRTKNYDFPSLDTFYIDDKPISDKLVSDGYSLKYVYDKPRTSGQLIKIATGDAVQKTSE